MIKNFKKNILLRILSIEYRREFLLYFGLLYLNQSFVEIGQK